MFCLFETGFASFTWGNGVMLVIGGVLLYLGIVKKMEPLLLVPIGFGVLLINLPLGGLMAGVGADALNSPKTITIIMACFPIAIVILVFFFSSTIRNYRLNDAIRS